MKVLSVLSFFLYMQASFVWAQQRVNLNSIGYGTPLGGANFDFAPANPTGSTCQQVCPNFYTKASGDTNGYFKFSVWSIEELNSAGQPCCNGCQVGVGCNNHVVQLYDYFNTTVINPAKVVLFTGSTTNAPTLQRACTAADGLTICAVVTISYQVYDIASTIMIGTNDSFNVRANSLFAIVKVTNWPYVAGSQGLRFYLDLAVRNTNPNGIVINPGELSNPNTLTGFDTATIIDAQNREAGLAFVKYVVFDDLATAVPVNVTGPISDINDISGYFFAVDTPRRTTSTSVTAYFNIFLPTLTGGTDVVASSSLLQPIFAIIFSTMIFLYLSAC